MHLVIFRLVSWACYLLSMVSLIFCYLDMYFPLLHSDGHFIYAILFHYVMYSDVVDVFELYCSTYRHVADLNNTPDLLKRRGVTVGIRAEFQHSP